MFCICRQYSRTNQFSKLNYNTLCGDCVVCSYFYLKLSDRKKIYKKVFKQEFKLAMDAFLDHQQCQFAVSLDAMDKTRSGIMKEIHFQTMESIPVPLTIQVSKIQILTHVYIIL